VQLQGNKKNNTRADINIETLFLVIENQVVWRQTQKAPFSLVFVKVSNLSA
jgi:hypothetical protein